MNEHNRKALDEYYAAAESWSKDRARAESRFRRIAWIVAIIAGLIAVLEALALVALIPLKREVPYTLMVDKETGYIQALHPLDAERITADTALTRSFLVQYVIARESFDASTIQSNYRKVGLWSAGAVRDRYLAEMGSNNPKSPLINLPRDATVDVQIRSVSSLNASTSLVRFRTLQTNPGAGGQLTRDWAATINFRYADAEMSAADRLINPLGFQVIRYRKDAESLPDVTDSPEAAASSTVDHYATRGSTR